MAYIFDASVYFTAALNPTTTSFTAGAGALLLTVGVGVVGTTLRTNFATSPPTYGGKPLTLISCINPAAEVITELWFLLNPSAGTYTISIPNATTSKTLMNFASTYKSNSSAGLRYDSSAAFIIAVSNPATDVNFSRAGVAVQMFGTGSNTAVTTCTPGYFVSQRGDLGNYQFAMSYYIPSSPWNEASMGFGGSGTNSLITGVWSETNQIKSVARLQDSSIVRVNGLLYSSVEAILKIGN